MSSESSVEVSKRIGQLNVAVLAFPIGIFGEHLLLAGKGALKTKNPLTEHCLLQSRITPTSHH